MKPRLSMLALLALVFVAAGYLVSQSQSQAPARAPHAIVDLNFASLGGATDAGVYIAEANGWFHDAGFNVATKVLTSIPAQVAEAATNAIDVSGIALAPGLFASVARGINLRLVGDKQSLRPGFSSTRIVARPQFIGADEAETLRNLRGKKIAGPGRSSIGYFLVAALFRKYGMGLSDFDFVELALADMAPALASGAVDATLLIEPFLSRLLRDGVAKQVSDLTEFVPVGGSISLLIYSEKFAANRDAGNRFMKAYMRGVRAYNDSIVKGVDRERIVEIIARGANAPIPVIRDSFPAGLDPDQRFNKSFLVDVQKFFVAQRFVEQPADIDRMVDTGFAEAARAELGAYDAGR